MQKRLWFVVGLAGMIAASSAPAAAQYHTYNSFERDVEVDLSVLDEVEVRKNVDDRTYDTVPPIKPVLQAPLPLTPGEQMRTEPSAPVPLAETPESVPAPAAPSFDETFPVTPPVGRVLKPSAALPLPESVVEAVNAVPPTPPAEEPTAHVVTPPRPPSNYPSYMTQPDAVSTPPEKSGRVMMPAHKPASVEAIEAEAVTEPEVELGVEEIAPPPASSPAPAAAEEDQAEPISLLAKPPAETTTEVATPVEGKEMPVQDVTQEINAPAPEAEKPAEAAPVTETLPLAEEAPAAVSPETSTEETTPPAPAAAVPSISDLSIDFEGNSSDITNDAQIKLANVVKQLEGTEGRIQVRSYATGEDGSKSSARRISLSRALAVRSFLMDNKIKPTRVDVRALGAETDRSPLDRVDIVFVR
jgi:outer membrane protein OmpA-like peptidoglycan-associated protein